MTRKSWFVTSIILFLFLLFGLYLWCKGSFDGKSGPAPSPGPNLPVERNAAPTENDKKGEPVDHPGLSIKKERELSSDPIQLPGTDPVDLEEHSMSLKKNKRAIVITPGVIYRSGEGISIKDPDREETIRIQRDNTYRSGEYRVFLERKY